MRKTIHIIILLAFLGFKTNAQYTKLYEFSGTMDGKNPFNSLYSDGTYLYGMTYRGGLNNYGTVFKIKPDGTGYIDLLDFASSNGAYPEGSLISDGIFLYGMTRGGGATNNGTVFKIMPDGSGFTKLYDFTGLPDGSNPCGSLIYDGTFLYGMTWTGGPYTNQLGTIFKIKPDGTGYQILLNFSGGSTGAVPYGSLIYDGTYLYGMAETGGGGSCSCGTIFKLKTDGSGFVKLLSFNGTNGSSPNGSLIYDGTYLYGMTEAGGKNGLGNIFKIMPNGTGFDTLLNFAGVTNGSHPLGSLIYSGTFIYGMTYGGGTNNNGTIFKIKSDGTGYSKLWDCDTTNGSNPRGDLVSDGTFLYGMTKQGGTNNDGVIFKLALMGIGIKEFYKEDIQINGYPNPVTDKISLAFNDIPNYENSIITIQNTLGETVKKLSFSKSVYVSDLPQGCYFLQITLQSGEAYKTKFIKQ